MHILAMFIHVHPTLPTTSHHPVLPPKEKRTLHSTLHQPSNPSGRTRPDPTTSSSVKSDYKSVYIGYSNSDYCNRY